MLPGFALSFRSHNACLSHFLFYPHFVAIFQRSFSDTENQFYLLCSFLDWEEGSWVQTYYHICSSFIVTQMITAVCMKMQHPLHIHMCTIFVQISLSSKQRWAGVFWFETFSPKKFQCVEREIVFRKWLVSVIFKGNVEVVKMLHFDSFLIEKNWISSLKLPFLTLKVNFYWRKHENIIWGNVTLPVFVLIQGWKFSKFQVFNQQQDIFSLACSWQYKINLEIHRVVLELQLLAFLHSA